MLAPEFNRKEAHMIQGRAWEQATPKIVRTSVGPIEYAEFGDGPPVVCLHGAMGAYDQSAILARTIGSDGYRYIAVSRPGYLGTPLSVGRSAGEQADACAALADALGIRDAGVMAVSGGGPCAIEFALKHRGRCRGLVLVSTCSGVVETPIPVSFQLTKLLARSPLIVKLLRRNTRANLERAAHRSVRDPNACARMLQDPEARSLFEALVMSTFDRMRQRLAGMDNDIAVTRTTSYELENIRVPVLVVHGTIDRLVPFEKHGQVLAARIPGARLLAVDGGEHVAIFTHRDRVKAEVGEFLARYVAYQSTATV